MQGELCLQHYADREIVMGVAGGISVVLAVVVIVAYREVQLDLTPDIKVFHIQFERSHSIK